MGRGPASNAVQIGGHAAQNHLELFEREHGGEMAHLRNQIKSLEKERAKLTKRLEAEQAAEQERQQRERERRDARQAELGLPRIRLERRALDLRIMLAESQFNDEFGLWASPIWQRPDVDTLQAELADLEAQIDQLDALK